MNSRLRAPRQARSRQTEERLLAATLAVIEAKGLAGVTIPAVAAAAGVATGSVYRRFEDKDAMVRAAFLGWLEAAQTANSAALAPPAAPGPLQAMSLDRALQAVGRALVAQYVGRTGVLKALDQYLEAAADAAFRTRATDLIEANLRLLIAALAPFSDRIAAAEPERAITFALLAATTVVEAHKLHDPLLWRRMLALDDEALAAEAARLMGAYLALK